MLELAGNEHKPMIMSTLQINNDTDRARQSSSNLGITNVQMFHSDEKFDSQLDPGEEKHDLMKKPESIAADYRPQTAQDNTTTGKKLPMIRQINQKQVNQQVIRSQSNLNQS